MTKWLDHISQITSESLARKINRRQAIGKFAGTVLGTLVSLTLFNGKAEAAACDNCQSWYTNDCNCHPPNNKYCTGCGSTAGSCPSGYKKSYAWGYSSTGCWCTSCYSGAADYKVCCDCTKSTNDAYTRYTDDCGCSWTYATSGYCVNSVPPASM